jgi:hypothetical protein
MSHHTPTPAERSAALNYMLRIWPTAHSMRYEGKCPDCKQRTLWSCQLPSDKSYTDKQGVEMEHCGFFCARERCRFGNAGSRPVENDELESAE